METFGNKYLHKKFKKQTSCQPKETVEGASVFNNGASSNLPSKDTGDPEPVKLVTRDNKPVVEIVPNYKSTNCLVTEHDERVDSVSNVKPDNQSSISIDVSTEQSSALSVLAATTCISSLNYTNANTIVNDSEENDLKISNFDTVVNVSEQNTLSGEKSSILSTFDKFSSGTSHVVCKSDGDGTCDRKLASTESGSGKYVCTYCNLACSKPSVLQKHIRAHTNERPFPCVSCGFSFKTRSNLYKHCRSRTHANRVMGNKHMQSTGSDGADADAQDDRLDDEGDDDSQRSERSPSLDIQSYEPPVKQDQNKIDGFASTTDQSTTWEQKSKPYKPKFHTAKVFFEENKRKENDVPFENTQLYEQNVDGAKNKNDHPDFQLSNSDFLKMRINDLINKNNSIVNSDDGIVIRRKYLDCVIPTSSNNDRVPSQQIYWQSNADYKPVDEPLNLTKNRKRCMSDSENSQKSLIKELLLKNLSADPNLQCQYCKISFQTVTELEMHKLKYCNAHTKNNNVRFLRSSSVNVATILSQNKQSYDDVISKPNTAFSLKSPGPFLGNTRLIENDKYKTFSFDDNVIINQMAPKSPNLNKYMLHSPNYPLSPQVKKNAVKMFGGEVKITQTSGETRSFKIEAENINKLSEESHNFMSFESENMVIKSTLQSGGTVLQNKTNYSPKLESVSSPNLIRVYDNDMMSPNLNLPNKFNYEKISQGKALDKIVTYPPEHVLKRGISLIREPTDNIQNSMKLDDKEKEFKSNLIDFGQKAVKLLAPNLKPPNLTIPGLPIPGNSEIYSPIDKDSERIQKDVISFGKKISLHQKMSELPQGPNVYNPVNLLVNGKVIRYVPGIPGPITDAPEVSNIISTGRLSSLTPKSPNFIDEYEKESYTPVTTIYSHSITTQFERITPTIIIDQHERKQTTTYPNKYKTSDSIVSTSKIRDGLEPSSKTEPKRCSPNLLITVSEKSAKDIPRKFIRPNSLPLKPSSVSIKSHHGLTPTMFNQALISPDTPRVAKKYCQQYLNGNYFSYLGLKSSTKSVYCTLNKTQPFYVMHFKKLSMYSEWRQQESKIDSISVSAYDSRQQQQKYSMAGQIKADLIAHSSYKFMSLESSSAKDEIRNKNNAVLGGYESNEDYTYIRGRGRGRYVCDQCGIRCKKPSMLKKHIRTHSDDRPYTCQHCNFSFKTKGNLTKHMKSKAHTKKYAETSMSAQNSVTTSSDSDDSDAESSDESTRLQEHEAAHCLLSLAQKNHGSTIQNESNSCSSYSNSDHLHMSDFFKDDKFLKNSEQIHQVNNSNFVKNKILDESSSHFNTKQHTADVLDANSNSSQETNNISQYLGKSCTVRPLTYPYLQTQQDLKNKIGKNDEDTIGGLSNGEKERYLGPDLDFRQAVKSPNDVYEQNRLVDDIPSSSVIHRNVVSPVRPNDFVEGDIPTNVMFRKRKSSAVTPSSSVSYKKLRTDSSDMSFKAMDLSYTVVQPPVLDLSPAALHSENLVFNGSFIPRKDDVLNLQFNKSSNVNKPESIYEPHDDKLLEPLNYNIHLKSRHNSFSESNSSEAFSQYSELNDRFVLKPPEISDGSSLSELPSVSYKPNKYDSKMLTNSDPDQSAMQTLAEIAIKQVKLEKNTLAKNVASEYLKLALKNEYNSNCDIPNTDSAAKKFVSTSKDTNDLIVKPEESKSCSICSKNFSKPSQLRLHMNIHYLERPFRCDSCSVSFRTKGHLQKHERSASHHNKLSSSPALSSSEPRPFKCSDCNIAFRIHGHLAKHLRSKLHIMKLECLAKIPFGLYAELERANSLLTEINTTDGEMCLESLKILARKLFSNDPNKLDQLANTNVTRDS